MCLWPTRILGSCNDIWKQFGFSRLYCDVVLRLTVERAVTRCVFMLCGIFHVILVQDINERSVININSY